MSKTKDEFLDHFARLGVFSKVQALMGPSNESDEVINKSEEGAKKGNGFFFKILATRWL